MDLPIVPLAGLIGVTVLSNLWVAACSRKTVRSPERWCFSLLALDTLTLTAMLFLTGGAHNPFSIFYLLHIALAAFLVATFSLWFIVVESALGFLLLFFSPFELQCHVEGRDALPFDLHLQGMLVALVLCGSFLAYFVSRLRAEFRKVEIHLEQEQQRNEHRRLITGLGTVAAGVAHELATPLGSIAVASGELEREASYGCGSSSCRDDARLISEQVKRCQQILSRMNTEAIRQQIDADKGAMLDTLPTAVTEGLSQVEQERIIFMGFDKDIPVAAPGEALVQALSALVNNALQAGAGDVKVEAELREGAVEIRVTDQGDGMNELERSRAGEPFYTTRQPGEGMGLGLFLVHMFCESVGGTFHLESSGKGTGTVATMKVSAASRKVS